MRTRRLVLKERDWAAAEGFAEQQGWTEEPVEDSGTGRKYLVSAQHPERLYGR
ncbi:hypothetical protein EV646_107145 [Kribbella antiqua]|uniref:Uncharacterized protein n=1 Tax=Kribbella antiqua TaxID=2512217 RepID=A0A4R2IM63_9ACTN|nr:hypothetical protein [Kribbella antiqua]TCO46124.1 hypothetical protein EV646_107145 [Kribbella antiqua]